MTETSANRGGHDADGEEGFTLVEVVIALVLLLIFSLGALPYFINATQYNNGSMIRRTANSIARTAFERARAADYSALASSEQIVTSTFGDYFVQTIVTDGSPGSQSATSVKGITVRVTPLRGLEWQRGSVVVTGIKARRIFTPRLGG